MREGILILYLSNGSAHGLGEYGVQIREMNKAGPTRSSHCMHSSTIVAWIAMQYYSMVSLDCLKIYILNPRETTKHFLKYINNIYVKGEEKGNYIKYSVKTRKGRKRGRGRNNKKYNEQKTDINMVEINPTVLIVSSNRNVLNTPTK